MLRVQGLSSSPNVWFGVLKKAQESYNSDPDP